MRTAVKVADIHQAIFRFCTVSSSFGHLGRYLTLLLWNGTFMTNRKILFLLQYERSVGISQVVCLLRLCTMVSDSDLRSLDSHALCATLA